MLVLPKQRESLQNYFLTYVFYSCSWAMHRETYCTAKLPTLIVSLYMQPIVADTPPSNGTCTMSDWVASPRTYDLDRIVQSCWFLQAEREREGLYFRTGYLATTVRCSSKEPYTKTLQSFVFQGQLHELASFNMATLSWSNYLNHTRLSRRHKGTK